MRVLEWQNESESLQACAAAGGAVADPNLRGWAALVPLEPAALSEGLRQSGLPVLEGARGALALGSIAQIWAAARSLADGLEREQARALAAELRRRVANVESGPARSELPPPARPQSRTPITRAVKLP